MHLIPVGRTDADEAEALVAHLNGTEPAAVPARPFTWEEAAGESAVVGGLDRAADAVGVLLAAVRSDRWAVVLVAGEPMRSASAAARRRARRSTGRCAVEAGESDPAAAREARTVEAVLQLVAVLERRRSSPQQAAGRLTEAGASQREAAETLGVSQQAVHARLRHGLWQEARTALDAVLPLLQDLAGSGSTGE